MLELMKAAAATARRVTKDQAAESVAYEAMLNAVKSFDDTKGVPLERWVCHCVKLGVRDYCRRQSRRKEENKELGWWVDCVSSLDEETEDIRVSREDWELLVDYHINKCTIFYLARRERIGKHAMRNRLRAAESRFKGAYSWGQS